MKLFDYSILILSKNKAVTSRWINYICNVKVFFFFHFNYTYGKTINFFEIVNNVIFQSIYSSLSVNLALEHGGKNNTLDMCSLTRYKTDSSFLKAQYFSLFCMFMTAFFIGSLI